MQRATAASPPPFLMISRHDYRSRRQVNVHFIARELATSAPTRFFSILFSALSRLKGDRRTTLLDHANRVETCGGVEAYLWKTLLHPCRLPAGLTALMAPYQRVDEIAST